MDIKKQPFWYTIRRGWAGIPKKALAPVAAAITKSESIVQKLIETVVDSTVGIDVAPDRAIPALAVLYAFWTYIGSGTLSVAGQAMSRPHGLDNDHPRKHRGNMEGPPLRLMSAPHSLIEVFSFFAAGACLAQVLAPDDQQILNLLGLHVLLKVFGFLPFIYRRFCSGKVTVAYAVYFCSYQVSLDACETVKDPAH
ncbi:hypothetical protein PDIDSM_3082 [Penicillium digitatum]|nr:hypothetical protein PDIDSM_3082 [Penicillium digitatum]